MESGAEFILPGWGDGSIVEVTAPSQADNPESIEFMGRLQRMSARARE